jgi:autotransporter-associated beta strand protein
VRNVHLDRKDFPEVISGVMKIPPLIKQIQAVGLFWVLSLAMVVSLTPAFAAVDYTWDTGTPPTFAVGDGIWDTTITNSNWTTDGGATDSAFVSNGSDSTGSNAIFGGVDGTYAISLGVASLNVRTMQFDNSGYTISALNPGTIAFGAVQAAFNIAAGKTVTIGNNITVTRNNSWNLTGGDTVGSVGTTTVYLDTGGRLQSTAGSGSGSINISKAALVVNGGTLQSRVTTGNVNLGGAANDRVALTIASGGTVMTGTNSSVGLQFNLTFGGQATVNLNGGMLQTGRIFNGGSGTSTFNFNGGQIQVSNGNSAATFMTGLSAANVKEGGAKIDTNGNSVTIGQALLHGGDAATDGGLAKSGAGTLTFSAANTYTGATDVNAGTLLIASGGSISATSEVSVANGASLSNANGAAIAEVLTLQEGATLVSSAASSTFDPTALELFGDLSDGWTAVTLTNSGGAATLLTKAGELTLTLSGITAGTYDLTSATGFAGIFGSANVNGNALATSDGGATFTGNVGGFDYTFTNASNQLIVAVPEPATWLMLALAGTFLVIRRQRGRSRI